MLVWLLVAFMGGGIWCCVPGCYKNTKVNKTLTFHRFPEDQALCKEWLKQIKRQGAQLLMENQLEK